ncbi:hypothetical protein CVT20_32400, partial [Pseudomonas aeruginosa]
MWQTDADRALICCRSTTPSSSADRAAAPLRGEAGRRRRPAADQGAIRVRLPHSQASSRSDARMNLELLWVVGLLATTVALF